MIYKKLCIVNSKILFELLFELVNELPFKVIFKNYNDLKSEDFNSKDILYLFHKNDESLISKFKIEQTYVIENLPIKIENLIRQINIKFFCSNI